MQEATCLPLELISIYIRTRSTKNEGAGPRVQGPELELLKMRARQDETDTTRKTGKQSNLATMVENPDPACAKSNREPENADNAKLRELPKMTTRP